MTVSPHSKFTDETMLVEALLKKINNAPPRFDYIEQQARVFIETIRKNKADLKGFNTLMQSYDLTSDEGLALMMLAEALLRIPDKKTANAMIQDKLSTGDWAHLFDQAADFTARMTGYGLAVSQKVMESMIGRLGMPVIRAACVEAMQMMGRTFVLGRNVEEAIKNAAPMIAKGYIYNFDMLGEGARTAKDADHYMQAYLHAVEVIGGAYGDASKSVLNRSGISVKLSALYPRYDYLHRDAAIRVLSEKLLRLCQAAAKHHLNVTVDAEECHRLDLSLEIIGAIAKNALCREWDGFGLAVQAYHKRAVEVIDRVIGWTDDYGCKISVRLVKGAYWDSEIKYAQVEGHPDYPVFTRKENTDLSYLVCAQKLLSNRDKIFPMFGTHNAYTAAAIIEMAGADKGGFIFQRLHGMGEQLHNQILLTDIPVCIYAPVGTHKYLLAYLVRRLLENGANSSFVNKVYDEQTPIDSLVHNPTIVVKAHGSTHRHPLIPLPHDIYGGRSNSKGLDLSDRAMDETFFRTIDAFMDKSYDAVCVINGRDVKASHPHNNVSPSNQNDIIGQIHNATRTDIAAAFEVLEAGFGRWSSQDVSIRAKSLETLADLYESNRNELIAVMIREAGKTIPDAVAEVREAVDFCRYYAQQAKELFAVQTLQGPTGEINRLMLEGRGIFVCISPWNFPLAIFTGQIAAALVCGNCVIAKPAEQTPAIADYAVRLMLKAGIPADVIALLQGDGDVGATILNHAAVAGVAFTGSTQVAKIIQRQLAAKEGAIVPLIAETGGINAMIVDSTALPEQVTDDVLRSAFGSAGQRCSALRLLCLQEDIADEVLEMIVGAMDYLTLGDPVHLSSDIGPIIDREAKDNLERYIAHMKPKAGRFVQASYDTRLDDYGGFLPPTLMELDSIDDLQTEAFGPVLHVIRYKEKDLADIAAAINAKGFGLTFGLHSRIHKRQEDMIRMINAGNIYINRGMTGAVVGVQPFGGRGLSGTGPKAGGPFYLHAFVTEKSVSDNITASGGNATLVNLQSHNG